MVWSNVTPDDGTRFIEQLIKHLFDQFVPHNILNKINQILQIDYHPASNYNFVIVFYRMKSIFGSIIRPIRNYLKWLEDNCETAMCDKRVNHFTTLRSTWTLYQ